MQSFKDFRLAACGRDASRQFMPSAGYLKRHGSTLIYDIPPGPPVTLTLAARLLPDLR
jgi:hypothetical protein